MTATDARLEIEVWSDVLCPWCYVGDARLEQAIKESPHADRIDIRVRTFQLDPDFPAVPAPVVEYLAAKKGLTLDQAKELQAQMADLARAEGLEYDPEHRVRNTLDMLRLVHLGNVHGVGWAYMTALQTALFSGDPEAFEVATLVRLGGDLGIPEAEIREVLDGDRYAQQVRAEHDEAIALGARGVPFTVLGRRIGIPGAVPTETYGQAIAQAWEQVDA